MASDSKTEIDEVVEVMAIEFIGSKFESCESAGITAKS
jgi:hypothetical protein